MSCGYGFMTKEGGESSVYESLSAAIARLSTGVMMEHSEHSTGAQCLKWLQAVPKHNTHGMNARLPPLS